MKHQFRSRKDAIAWLATKGIDASNWTELQWLKLSKSGAEIHIQLLAEAMWDALNESTPKQLKAGEWHIPYESKMDGDKIEDFLYGPHRASYIRKEGDVLQAKVEISTGMGARTSYTTVGDEKEIKYSTLASIHDKMVVARPFHASPFEHNAQVPTEEQYMNESDTKITGIYPNGDFIYQEGWFRNFRGFKQYRQILEERHGRNKS